MSIGSQSGFGIQEWGRRVVGTYLIAALLALGGQATPRDSLFAEGLRLAPMRPAQALTRFEAILARDSLDVPANWHAAVALSDLSLPLTQKAARLRRDSLLDRGQFYARRAVRLSPSNAPALFALGLVLGNTALTKGTREKVRMATEIRSLALRAIAADSTHDGAQHLLGRWNYEVMKLSGLERFIARSILGGGVFGEASWEEARRRLQLATSLDPERIYHRLDLARVLVARKDTAAARTELQRIAGLPNRVAADSTYRREAVELLARLGAP
jgi:tetratricopeptide (TPR) repeat protein